MSVLPRALTLAPRELPRRERSPRDEIAFAVDRDYWLSRCQGFAVEDGSQHIGHVEAIEYETRVDVPDFIILRTGRFLPRTQRVPVGDIAEIWPPEHVLVLHRRAP